MSTVDKRSVTLSPELAAEVDEAVAAGEYASASEVVRDALRQWKERRDLFGYTLEELRALVHEGIDSGPSVRAPPSTFPRSRARRAAGLSRRTSAQPDDADRFTGRAGRRRPYRNLVPYRDGKSTSGGQAA